MGDFQAAGSAGDSKERAQKYKDVVDAAIDGNDEAKIKDCLTRLLSDEVPQAISRNVVSHYANALSRVNPPSLLEEIGRWSLSALGPHVSSFEDADAALRKALFKVLLAQGDYGEAAGMLAGINMETSARAYSEVERAAAYVTVAETYLEDDEAVDAETFVNRASGLMHAVPADDWSLQLRYRVTLARTLDARRKFLDAAMRYYELSQASHAAIAVEELLTLLAQAVTCALLGNAGPRRSRILGLLSKDERVGHMEQSDGFAAHAHVLKKMFTGQLVRRPELAAFEATLMPHQKALQGDGLSIPERAAIQHNMVAVSNIYENISLNELGALLEIEPAKAETVVQPGV